MANAAGVLFLLTTLRRMFLPACELSAFRISTMDLRIASIALSRDMTVLTCNLGDFRKVPGLKVADWTV